MVIDEEQKKNLKLKNEVTLFNSRFEFLKSSCGLRPGKIHLFLGTTGTGKTTLIRSIQTDCAKICPITVYSAEEDAEESQYLISKRNLDEDILKNINYLDEDTVLKYVKPEDFNGLFEMITKTVVETNSKVLFFDNLTTAFYEGKRPGEQVVFYNALRSLGKRLNIPIVLVAHTKDGVKDTQGDLICPTDIRNSKHPSNRAEYLYIFQRFSIKVGYGREDLVATIRVLKSRLHDNSATNYILGFDSYKKEYTNDRSVSFDTFNDLFKSRLRLGMK